MRESAARSDLVMVVALLLLGSIGALLAGRDPGYWGPRPGEDWSYPWPQVIAALIRVGLYWVVFSALVLVPVGSRLTRFAITASACLMLAFASALFMKTDQPGYYYAPIGFVGTLFIASSCAAIGAFVTGRRERHVHGAA